jgi:hypothetical protein
VEDNSVSGSYRKMMTGPSPQNLRSDYNLVNLQHRIFFTALLTVPYGTCFHSLGSFVMKVPTEAGRSRGEERYKDMFFSSQLREEDTKFLQEERQAFELELRSYSGKKRHFLSLSWTETKGKRFLYIFLDSFLFVVHG